MKLSMLEIEENDKPLYRIYNENEELVYETENEEKAKAITDPEGSEHYVELSFQYDGSTHAYSYYDRLNRALDDEHDILKSKADFIKKIFTYKILMGDHFINVTDYIKDTLINYELESIELIKIDSNNLYVK